MIKDLKEEPRNLVDICNEFDFSKKLNGNVYCSLGYSRQVECPFYSKDQDHNGLYPCLNPKYQPLTEEEIADDRSVMVVPVQ